MSAPARCSPWLSLRPGRRWLPFRNSTLSPTVSSFLSREQLCFCLPAATSGKCYARVSAVRAGRLACPPPGAPAALPARRQAQPFQLPCSEGHRAEFFSASFSGRFGGAFRAAVGVVGRDGPPWVGGAAGMLCCGPQLRCLLGGRDGVEILLFARFMETPHQPREFLDPGLAKSASLGCDAVGMWCWVC